MEEQSKKMTANELGALVKHVSRLHPVGMIKNIPLVGVVGAGLFGLVFDRKSLFGVVVFIILGIVGRYVIFAVLNWHLRRKYSDLARDSLLLKDRWIMRVGEHVHPNVVVPESREVKL